jgi:hypothetical protein
MRRGGLIVAILLTVSLTGLVLHQAGWFAGPATSRHPEPRGHVKAVDPYSSEAAWRYRFGQPHHWRALMLQH